MTNVRHPLCWVGLLMGLALAGYAQAQPRTPIEQVKPNALELIQLPRYCLAAYGDASMKQQPGTNIVNCGPRMNHFCPALLALLRASDVTRERDQRRFLARYAQGEVRYSLDGIPATCPILADVKMAQTRAELLVSLLK